MRKIKFKKKVSIDLLDQLCFLTEQQQRSIMGGYGSYGGYSTPSGYGGYNNYAGYSPAQFANYVKTTTAEPMSPGVYSTNAGYSFYSGNKGSSTYGDWGNYGGYGDPKNPIQLQEVTITPNASHQINAWEAMNWANTSLGTSFSHAEALIKKTKGVLPKGLKIAGAATGFIGVVENGYQFAFGDGDWQDGVQFAAGAALLLFPVSGSVLLIGSTALFIWELAE